MERVTVVKNFNGTLALHPQTAHLRNRDGVAFSCRLRPDPPPAAEEDSEISIFDAKKYFNDPNLDQNQKIVVGNNRVSPVSQCRDDSSVGGGAGEGSRFSSASSEMGYGRNYRTRSFHATPTASSEASWNSQTGLLTNPTGAVQVKLRSGGDSEKKRGSAARWLFGRKCPCAGKKSVQVDCSEPKTPNRVQSSISVPSPNSNNPRSKLEDNIEQSEPETVSISQSMNNRFSSGSENHTERVSAPAAATGFTFPILGPAKLSSVPDPPRDSVESLEVFRPSNQRHQFPPPERDCQIFTFPTSPKSRALEDDMTSDASSDLFEIESFSTQTTATTTTAYPMMTCPRRESLDEAASFNARRLGGGGVGLYSRRSLEEAAPTECYEPSEASIDWSVTTAEGFERGSVASYSMAAAELEESVVDRVGGGGGKRRGNGMLSCRSEKAVSVGPHPQPVAKWVPPVQGHVVGRVAGGIGHRKPPLGSSGSARSSLAFAT